MKKQRLVIPRGKRLFIGWSLIAVGCLGVLLSAAMFRAAFLGDRLALEYLPKYQRIVSLDPGAPATWVWFSSVKILLGIAVLCGARWALLTTFVVVNLFLLSYISWAMQPLGVISYIVFLILMVKVYTRTFHEYGVGAEPRIKTETRQDRLRGTAMVVLLSCLVYFAIFKIGPVQTYLGYVSALALAVFTHLYLFDEESVPGPSPSYRTDDW